MNNGAGLHGLPIVIGTAQALGTACPEPFAQAGIRCNPLSNIRLPKAPSPLTYFSSSTLATPNYTLLKFM